MRFAGAACFEKLNGTAEIIAAGAIIEAEIGRVWLADDGIAVRSHQDPVADDIGAGICEGEGLAVVVEELADGVGVALGDEPLKGRVSGELEDWLAHFMEVTGNDAGGEAGGSDVALEQIVAEEESRGGEEDEQESRGGESRGAEAIASEPGDVAFEHADGPGVNGFGIVEALEIIGEFARGSVAGSGFLPEAFEGDDFQVPGDFRIEEARGGRRDFNHLPKSFEEGIGAEGRAAGERFVKNGPERIDIAGNGELAGFAAGLFGRHVAGGADDRTGDGEIGFEVELTREAEVGDAWFALFIDEDVGGLEIAMEDALLMGVVNGLGNFPDERGSLREGKGACAEGISETFAFDEFHGEEVVAVFPADFVNGNDVGMAEARDGLGLNFEAADFLLGSERASEDDFEGNDAVEAFLAGLVNDAHAALADDFEDFVAGEFRRGKRGGGCGEGESGGSAGEDARGAETLGRAGGDGRGAPGAGLALGGRGHSEIT